jgi:hypothetical protein
MKNSYESDDDLKVHFGNSVVVHYMCARLCIKIKSSNVNFSFRQKPIDPFSIYSHKDMLIEQMLSGVSEPVDNSLLPIRVFNRQPLFNQLFTGKEILVNIVEKAPKEDMSPFWIHIDYYRNKPSITLNWHVSDRSFFTRLISQLSTREFLKIQITTDKNDSDFEPYTLDPSLELQKFIRIKDLFLTF